MIIIRYLLLIVVIVLMLPALGQADDNRTINVSFHDEAGREFIPRGFVVVTEQAGIPSTEYTLDDYRRMVRRGANFQVIRLALGSLGGWPGNEAQKEYLEKLDSLVGYGKTMGLKTCFKLTVYGCKGFNWTALWKNDMNQQDDVVRAWQSIWHRYKDDNSVFGYDLLNEPHKGDLHDYRTCEKECLAPLYRRLIDELRKIDSEKYTLIQPILRNNEDRPQDFIPFVEFTTPIERKGVVYAPHIYEGKLENLEPTLDRYAKEAALLDAPLMIGEWGPATLEMMDKDWDAQARFRRLYLATTEIFDQRGLGCVKAWFTGTGKMYHGPRGPFTWSLFHDPVAVGTAERKYIMDFIARPGPMAVAGRIQNYGFDFPTRIFKMEVKVDREQGTSTIFVGADRHYPDGFSVLLNHSLIIASDPLKGGELKVLKSPEGWAEAISWDPSTQRLCISQWPGTNDTATLKLIPGISGITQVYSE